MKHQDLHIANKQKCKQAGKHTSTQALRQAQHTTSSADIFLKKRSTEASATPAGNNNINMNELEGGSGRPSPSSKAPSDSDRNSNAEGRDDINRNSTQPNGIGDQFDSDVDARNDPSTNSCGKQNVHSLDNLSMNPSMIALTTVEIKQGDKTIILTGNINQTDPQNSILHGVQRSGVGSPKRDLAKRINSSIMICVLVPKEKEEEGDEVSALTFKKPKSGFFSSKSLTDKNCDTTISSCSAKVEFDISLQYWQDCTGGN